MITLPFRAKKMIMPPFRHELLGPQMLTGTKHDYRARLELAMSTHVDTDLEFVLWHSVRSASVSSGWPGVAEVLRLFRQERGER